MIVRMTVTHIISLLEVLILWKLRVACVFSFSAT